MRNDGFAMRITRYLPWVIVALTLVNCTVPGGIYKGYEGPDKDLKDLAVLDWSAGRSDWDFSDRTAPRSGLVMSIDGRDVPGSLRLFGVETTRAYLLPGLHTITVENVWEELGDWTDFFLRCDLQAGRSYAVVEVPCKHCDRFEVTVTIKDMETGAIVGMNVRVGSESYGAARSRLYWECVADCEEGDTFCELLCP